MNAGGVPSDMPDQNKDPGELGIYGFRNRKDHTYDGLSFATSWAVKEKTVWDILSDNDKESIVITEALELSASAQLRNMATIGGNIMQRTRCTYFRVSWKGMSSTRRRRWSRPRRFGAGSSRDGSGHRPPSSCPSP
mgnify:CR=1 FL=1